MKKVIKIIVITMIICGLSNSCARKINGATPHRRDRNCGCEYIPAHSDESELADFEK